MDPGFNGNLGTSGSPGSIGAAGASGQVDLYATETSNVTTGAISGTYSGLQALPAFLQIVAPTIVALASPTNDEHIVIQIPTTPGYCYRLMASSNLLTGFDQIINGNISVTGSNSIHQEVLNISTQSRFYYRIEEKILLPIDWE